ncbi:MAG TPA: hypothetical protein VH302_00630 [Bryobacteraceae bacterium]|jgi:hypothetical protein|nr:hypothetical protein [Bryobacteraceae bacterium]
MPDTVSDAQQLADLFTKLAGEVDGFRNAHYDDLTPQQRGAMEAQIQQLYDFHDEFAGEALQKTLDVLQGDLTQLANIAREADDAFHHLKSIQRAIDIVSAASNIAQAIATGGYGQLPDAVRVLAQAVQGSDDKSDSD